MTIGTSNVSEVVVPSIKFRIAAVVLSVVFIALPIIVLTTPLHEKSYFFNQFSVGYDGTVLVSHSLWSRTLEIDSSPGVVLQACPYTYHANASLVNQSSIDLPSPLCSIEASGRELYSESCNCDLPPDYLGLINEFCFFHWSVREQDNACAYYQSTQAIVITALVLNIMVAVVLLLHAFTSRRFGSLLLPFLLLASAAVHVASLVLSGKMNRDAFLDHSKGIYSFYHSYGIGYELLFSCTILVGITTVLSAWFAVKEKSESRVTSDVFLAEGTAKE